MLLGLGIPQTIDSFLVLYARSLVNIDEPGPLPPSATAEAAANLLRSADRWTGDPDARIEAGIIERRLAARATNQAEGAASLEAATKDLSSGLGRAPANSRGWAELAVANLGLAKVALSLAAWRSSILMANYDPALNFWRAQIGTDLWLALAPDDRRLLASQLRFSWDHDRDKLISFAKQSSIATQATLFALGSDPSRLAAFNKALQSGL